MIPIDMNQIHCMDWLKFTNLLPDESVDLMMTDPPYGIQYQNNYTFHKHSVLKGDSGIDYTRFAQESYRILKNNTHAYFYTRFDVYPYHYHCLVQAGFQVKNCLVIEKGQNGGIGDLYGSYSNNSEWVIFCQKGRRTFQKTKLLKNSRSIGKRTNSRGNPIQEYKTRFPACWFGSDYPKSNWNASLQAKYQIFHPTIKNPVCLEWLIQISSKPGELVCDPFMGSGTTALAAINTKRNFIGCEIDRDYHKLSIRRIKQRMEMLGLEKQ